MTTWLQWGCVSWRKTQTVIAGKGSILRQWQNMSIKADVILYKYKCVVSCTWQCGSYEVDQGKFSRTRRKEPARFSSWVFVDLWVGWWWSRTWRRWCRSSSSYFMFFLAFAIMLLLMFMIWSRGSLMKLTLNEMNYDVWEFVSGYYMIVALPECPTYNTNRMIYFRGLMNRNMLRK